jgi:hypothetical protein
VHLYLPPVSSPNTREYLVRLLNDAQPEVRLLHESEEGRALLKEIKKKYDEKMEMDAKASAVRRDDEDSDTDRPKRKGKAKAPDEDVKMENDSGSEREEEEEEENVDTDNLDLLEERQDLSTSVSEQVYLVHYMESERDKELEHFHHGRRITLATLKLDPNIVYKTEELDDPVTMGRAFQLVHQTKFGQSCLRLATSAHIEYDQPPQAVVDKIDARFKLSGARRREIQAKVDGHGLKDGEHMDVD